MYNDVCTDSYAWCRVHNRTIVRRHSHIQMAWCRQQSPPFTLFTVFISGNNGQYVWMDTMRSGLSIFYLYVPWLAHTYYYYYYHFEWLHELNLKWVMVWAVDSAMPSSSIVKIYIRNTTMYIMIIINLHIHLNVNTSHIALCTLSA